MTRDDYRASTSHRALMATASILTVDDGRRRFEVAVPAHQEMEAMLLYTSGAAWMDKGGPGRRVMMLVKGQAIGPTVAGLPVHDRPLAVLCGPLGTGMSGGRMFPVRVPGALRGHGKSTLTDLVRRLCGEVPA